jgi:hypothetical protein
MVSFLKKVNRKKALGSTLSPATKEFLGEEAWKVVNQDLDKMRSDFAGHLSRIENKVKTELEKAQNAEQFAVVKKQIRTALAKWLYLSSLKK